jgi:hypothetical protein
MEVTILMAVGVDSSALEHREHLTIHNLSLEKGVAVAAQLLMHRPLLQRQAPLVDKGERILIMIQGELVEIMELLPVMALQVLGVEVQLI